MNKNIEELLSKINSVDQEVRGNFEFWNSTTKNYILNILNLIAEKDSKLYVEVNSSIINHEHLYLSYRNEKSNFGYNENDFYNIQEGHKGIIIEDGAYIAFSLTLVGKVHVWMTFPRIRELMSEEREGKPFGVFEQSELDEPKVLELVSQFFNEVINWKSGSSNKYHPIGFKRNKIQKDNDPEKL